MKRILASAIRNNPALKALLKPISNRFFGESRNSRYDSLTEQLIRKLVNEGDNCIDAGCHAGEIMDCLLECSPSGRHFGFEPLPSFNAYLLKRYAGKKNVEIFPYALATDAGEAKFTQNIENPGYSGLQQREMPKDADRVREITVEMRRLDSVVPLDVAIRLIKIDVEGGEMGVLEGGRAVVEKYRPYVIFEHGRGAAEFYGTSPRDIFKYFDELDYALFPVNPALGAVKSDEEIVNYFDNGLEYYFIAVPNKEESPWN